MNLGLIKRRIVNNEIAYSIARIAPTVIRLFNGSTDPTLTSIDGSLYLISSRTIH